ncbi:MAG: S-layer homology domain-containing protein [Candidatus Obscuribacterales bacterium]|nr:S-layer homology domain-containing protein [Candidatus Obscuribacterales bacterium]
MQKRVQSRLFSLVAATLLLMPPAVQAARYVDVSGDWCETYINILSDKGIFTAEPDGKFKPSDPVTRAMLAAWLVKVLGLENQPVPTQASFPDVKTTDWFFKPVEIIRQNNYISGYADGFRPNQFISKGEVASILARALTSPAPDEQAVSAELGKYKDAANVPAWARTGVAQLSAAGVLLVGPDTSTIGADKVATRADTAALLYKLDEYIGKRDVAQAIKNATQPAQQGAARPAPPQGPPQGWQAAGPQYGAGGGVGAPLPQYSGPPPGYNGGYPQQGQAPYGAPPGYGPPPGYRGQVALQNSNADYFPAQSPSPPQGGGGYYSGTPQYGQPPAAYQPPPGNPLQGGVAIVSAGTQFRAQLKNSLDSASSQPGEEVRCTLGNPVYANGSEVIPAGSLLVGTVTSVTPASRFKAGANGKIDIRFNSVETPDGRKIPLQASIDADGGIKLVGGSTAGRVGKGLLTTGAGAAGGAALGTALGAIVGGTTRGNVGKSTGMGAVFGTALGAGVGGVGAIVRKGSDVKIPAGTSLPVKLDENMQVTLGSSGPPTGFGQQPGGYQQPQGYGY